MADAATSNQYVADNTFATSSAYIFNATIAGAAIAAALELGITDELKTVGRLNIPAFCSTHNLDTGCVLQIIRALAGFDIACLDPETQVVTAGPAFPQINADKGYFLWLVGGYGHALQNLAVLARSPSSPQSLDGRSLVKRDGRAVSLAAKYYGVNYVDREFLAALGPCEDDVIADLGCGSAARLIDIVARYPGTKGIGIDIDPSAISVAREAVKLSGFDNQIQLVCADARTLIPHAAFAPVTILTSFFMGHDLWPKARCLEVLQILRTCFPKVKRLLLCDTHRSEYFSERDIPIFTLGFELLHAVMRQEIPTRSQWMDLFAESSWECVNIRSIGIPYSVIFELNPRT